MGLSLTELKSLTLGQYLDIFDAYKEIYNMEINRITYIIPEKLNQRTSMRDL